MAQKKSWWFNDPEIKRLFIAAGASSYRGLRTSFLAPRTLVGSQALQAFFESSAGLFDPRKVLLVTDEGMAGASQRVVQHFKRFNFEVKTWEGVEPEVPLDCIRKGGAVAREFAPSLLVGFGGGSVIDCAKAIWVLYEREDLEMTDVHPLRPLNLRKKCLMMGIPTTSGTGSESTNAFVITDDEGETPVKISLLHPEVVPDFAVIDPRFVLGMPSQLAAGTGLDALTHAVESYISTWCSDYSGPLSIQAARLIFEYMARSVYSGKDREARYKMHVAANLAGLSFSNAVPGTAHSAGHAFGKLFGVHHGIAVGLFLPYVLQYHSRVSKRGEHLAAELGVASAGDESALPKLVERIRELYREVGGPLSGRELVDEEMFKEKLDVLSRVAAEDPITGVSARPINEEGCRRLMEYAYYGLDIDF